MVTAGTIDGIDRALFFALATALSYPGPGLIDSAREAEALTPAEACESAKLLGRFRGFVETTPAAQLEEAYTRTFELQALCPPYVGFHLFGESYKRSVFLVGLRKSCREYGVESDTELPDHLARVLRLLSVCTDPVLVGELIDDAVVPALSRMIDGERAPGPEVEHQLRSDMEQLEQSHEEPAPYLLVLIALKGLLEGRPYRTAAPAISRRVEP